jgi:hypothetical protein
MLGGDGIRGRLHGCSSLTGVVMAREVEIRVEQTAEAMAARFVDA